VAAAAAGPSALSKRQQKQQQQQQRATAARVAASASPSYASLSPNSGQSGSGGSRDFLQGSILKFPVGKRPVELQVRQGQRHLRVEAGALASLAEGSWHLWQHGMA
jgi:hypothetical protein